MTSHRHLIAKFRLVAVSRTAAAHPDSHPDLHEAFARHGVVHTSNGRRLPSSLHTAASSEEQEARLADPTGWSHHVAFQPVHKAVQGARAYAAKVGLPDPHQIDYSRIRTDADTVRSVGRHYDSLPSHDPVSIPSFEALRRETAHQFDHLTNGMGINVQVTDQDPYSDVHEMLHDVQANNRMQVLSTAMTGGHPFLTDEENDKFRAVHDFFGHAATGRSFDRHGENAAYLAHAQMFSPAAHAALASETKGQNNSLILNGDFAPQKITLMHPQYWAHDLAKTGINRAARRKLSNDQPMYILLPHWDPAACVDIMKSHAAGVCRQASRRIALPQVTPELMEQARQGGFTLHDHIGDGPTHGYMCAIAKDSEDKTPIELLDEHHVTNFINQNADALNTPGHYLGGWLQNGHFYLDISKHHKDLHSATKAAIQHDQLGIYDLGNGREGRTINTEDAGMMTGHPRFTGKRYDTRQSSVPHFAQGHEQRQTDRGHHAGCGWPAAQIRNTGHEAFHNGLAGR